MIVLINKSFCMIAHLFKLIWNKKKKNFLLMLEMLISFIVLFGVFTGLVYFYQNYSRPMGFEYERVWSVGYGDPAGMTDADSIAAYHATVKRMIQSMPQVEAVSFSNINVPFGDANLGTSVSYNNQSENTEIYRTDDDYKKTLGITVTAGRWFSKEDDVAREKPVVINEALKKNLFGDGPAVGKQVGGYSGGPNWGNARVVGVVNEIKDKGDLVAPRNAIYTRMDTSNQGRNGALLVKVKPGTDAVFEGRLYKALAASFRNTSIDIEHLENQRLTRMNQLLAPVIVLLAVAGFLVINVALGLFGVLWYSINKRRSEIGIRRAVGASGGAITRQLIAETLVLSTLSLIVGAFFAVQFPLLNLFDIPAGTYLTALLLAVLFIYLLVVGCAFYPGRQAAAIYPAEALHED